MVTAGRPIKRIMFVQPPAFSWRLNRLDINPNPPLGLAYLAAILQREGYEVIILDAFVEGWFREPTLFDEDPAGIPKGALERVGLTFAEIGERITAFKPDLLGVTSLFTCQRRNVHAICRLAKQIDRDMIVVTGGKNPTALTDVTMQDPNVDFVLRGEAEVSILQLIRSLESGGDLMSIDGLAFRDRQGRVFVNSKDSFIEDLNALPFPARELLPMEMYFDAAIAHGGSLINRRYASMITSRGCPAECFFCSAHGSMGYKFRYRSVENVMAEIDHLVDRYQIGEILFEDDNLTMHRERAKQLFDALIERNYNLTWDTPNGLMAITLDHELIEKMSRSGCYRVNLAIESGDQHVVNNVIRKPLDLRKVPALIDKIREVGMKPGLFLVIGNPGESLEQMRTSYRFARQNKVVPHVSIAMPLPGTELLEIAQRNHYLLPDFSWENLTIDAFSMETPDWTVDELRSLKAFEDLRLRVILAPQFVSKIVSYFGRRPVDTLTNIANGLVKSSQRETFSYLKFGWVLKGALQWLRSKVVKPQAAIVPATNAAGKPTVLKDSAMIQFPQWGDQTQAEKHASIVMPISFVSEHKWTARRAKTEAH